MVTNNGPTYKSKIFTFISLVALDKQLLHIYGIIINNKNYDIYVCWRNFRTDTHATNLTQSV
jgi:hypothetical protein